MDIKAYSYNGPVKEFDRVIDHHWIGSTYAMSEAKARSNLVYQYKVSHNKTPDSKISLPGKIIMR